MWKAKIFLSDYADMCLSHLSMVFRRLNVLPVSRSKTFYALDLTMEVDQTSALRTSELAVKGVRKAIPSQGTQGIPGSKL